MKAEYGELKDNSGEIRLLPESIDDLWHLQHLVAPGILYLLLHSGAWSPRPIRYVLKKWRNGRSGSGSGWKKWSFLNMGCGSGSPAPSSMGSTPVHTTRSMLRPATRSR